MARFTKGDVALVATVLGVGFAVLGGGIWLGNIDAKAETALQAASGVQAIKIDQAVIREQIQQIRRDGEDRDERQQQAGERYDRKLETILQEIRRRNTNGR